MGASRLASFFFKAALIESVGVAAAAGYLVGEEIYERLERGWLEE